MRAGSPAYLSAGARFLDNLPGCPLSLNRANSVGLSKQGTAITAVEGIDWYGASTGVSAWTDLKQVSAGYHFTVGLKKNGTVLTTVGWDNYINQNYTDAHQWQNIQQVTAGSYHILGLKTDGTLVAAGDKAMYQEQKVVSSSVTVQDFEPVALSMGDTSAQAIFNQLKAKNFLQADGTVTPAFFALESAYDLNLDYPYEMYQEDIFSVLEAGVTSESVAKLAEWNQGILQQDQTPFIQVTAGDLHIAALRADGTVVAAGDNEGGRYTGVETWTNITQISAGVFQTLGLKRDGTIVAAGNNGYQQSDLNNWNKTVATNANKKIIQVAAGYLQTAALRADGTVAVSATHKTYDQVQNWTNVTQIAAGGDYVVGITADHKILVDLGDSPGVDSSIQGKALTEWENRLF